MEATFDVVLKWRLPSFVEKMNSYHQTIKFTTEMSKANVSYLYVPMSRSRRVLDTDLLSKAKDTRFYAYMCKNISVS